MFRPPRYGPRGYPNHNFRPRDFIPHGFRGCPPNYGDNFTKEYWCETCDRDFKSAQLLENHKQQHEKCKIDGCQFIAHPKVITKHIQMQHSSGLFNKIAKLNNPEEINKWREERRKKYPTKENVERKAAEIEEKIGRGEKMCLKRDRNKANCDNPQYGKKRQLRNSGNNSNNNGGYKNPKKEKTYQKPHPPKRPKTDIKLEENNKILKPFTGISNLIMSDDEGEDEPMPYTFLIADDDVNENQPIEKPEENPALCGALSSLINNYGSSDEEEDTSKPNSAINKEKVVQQDIQPNTTATVKIEQTQTPMNSVLNDIDDDGPPEEAKTSTVKESETADVNLKPEPLKHRSKDQQIKNRRGNNVVKRQNYKPPSTLLQKLLFKEVRQERNMVLQCIRYILKNNYFDKI